MSELFKRYQELTRDKQTYPRTLHALEELSKTRSLAGLRALELGSGSGRDTRYMLEQGMQVTAVDVNTGGIDYLASDPNLTAVESTFDNFSFGTYDFVSSQYALSFNPPETFDAMIAALTSSILPGGMLSCNIFGTRDEWTYDKSKTFLTEEQIRTILEGFDIKDLIEVEKVKPIADGEPKNWHYFDIHAVKAL